MGIFTRSRHLCSLQWEEPAQAATATAGRSVGLSINLNGIQRGTAASSDPRLRVSPLVSHSWKLFVLSIAEGEELESPSAASSQAGRPKMFPSASCTPNHPDEGVPHLDRRDGLSPRRKRAAACL